MKHLLIKIGQAWNVIRQDGIVRGGRRVLIAFLALFRPVHPGDILFISGGVGESARYRTIHVAEELSRHGFKASVTVQDNPYLLSYTHKFSVFVFHRVLYTENIKKFISLLKEEEKEIIFETDDLVYDPAFLVHMDYYEKMNALERKLYEHGVGGEILADPYVKVATTTTHFLADKLRERGKRVFVVPNKLSDQDVAWAETLLKMRSRATDNPKEKTIRIGYLSGTISHNKDFATIIEPLQSILREHPETRLVLVGPLDTGQSFDAFRDQVETIPFTPRRKFFELVASLDINLAPLEIGNPFCESKSELKFFEAGLLGVPTVAAATDTFRRAITDGVDGMVAETKEEWQAKLERLINAESLRHVMGEKARTTALTKYATTTADNEAYYSYLQAHIHSS